MTEKQIIQHIGAFQGTPPVAHAPTFSERCRRLHIAYREHQKRVDAGVDSWGDLSDPYAVADWPSIFTPIEADAWTDIRAMGLPLWPQLPAGGYLLDFGNPVARVALECDGALWHQDVARDERRDNRLAKLGWRVFRAPGRVCKVESSRPDDWAELSDEQRQRFEQIREGSLRPVLLQIREILTLAGQMERGE